MKRQLNFDKPVHNHRFHFKEKFKMGEKLRTLGRKN